MGIGNKLGSARRFGQQPSERLAMALRRRRDPNRLAIKPPLDLAPGGGGRLGAFEDSWIGHDPEERHEARPRKADSSRPVEPPVEPVARRVVLREIGDTRVDEQIRIDDDQR